MKNLSKNEMNAIIGGGKSSESAYKKAYEKAKQYDTAVVVNNAKR